uniref:Uncharacterized protein n=1 Tax=Glossina pallidipes TaxID=7398 RepID=A0A1B0A6N5_GLOPL
MSEFSFNLLLNPSLLRSLSKVVKLLHRSLRVRTIMIVLLIEKIYAVLSVLLFSGIVIVEPMCEQLNRKSSSTASWKSFEVNEHLEILRTITTTGTNLKRLLIF